MEELTMTNKFTEAVYQTLIGQLLPEYQVPGVENAFAPGNVCNHLYQRIYEAKLRLCQRLGVIDDDTDIEDIVDAYEDITEYLCEKCTHTALLTTTTTAAARYCVRHTDIAKKRAIFPDGPPYPYFVFIPFGRGLRLWGM